MSARALAAVVAALATAPVVLAGQPLAPNAGNPNNANPSANCIAIFSSQVTHNGSSINDRASHGQRGRDQGAPGRLQQREQQVVLRCVRASVRHALLSRAVARASHHAWLGALS